MAGLSGRRLRGPSGGRQRGITAMSEGEDKELILGTGRLLGLFFGLVILCSVFFGLGFSLGRNSMKGEMSGPAVLPTPPAADASVKPAPEAKSPASSSDELTFFKAVQKTESTPQLEKSADSPVSPAGDSAVVKPVAQAAPAAAGLNAGTGYMVQVAAVSKQEDANALVDALRKKQYPVFVASAPGDSLFHVQLGPFADPKDADTMRSRLLSDGYNPIVKK